MKRSCLALVWVLTLAAQPQQPPAPQPGFVIRKNVQEVMVDVVVRDKRERTLTDLKANEVEVYEDGVKQDQRSFRLVSGAEVREVEESKSAAPKTPRFDAQRQINLVLLVFRIMNTGARERQVAAEAAEDFLKNELRANTLVGVFSLDYRLNALTPFTNNVAQLRKAVRDASTTAYREFARVSDSVLSQSELDVTGSATGMTVSGGEINTRSPGGSIAGAEVASGTQGSQVMRALLNADRRTFAGIEGLHEIDAMRVMVQQLSLLPGRKTVILLTTGLQLPPDQFEVFDALKGIANRYNVTFYALDVHGLTTYSPNWANSGVVSAAAGISATQGQTAAVRAGQAQQDDIVTYGVRAANPQESLNDLSRSTGGFLIANTNDLRKPLTKIMEDVNTHYEIAYSPKSDIFDGSHRKIEVRVLRAGVHVQSRNGYYALPDLDGKPVEPFEVAALKVLDTKPAPRDLPYRVATARFRPGTGGWQQTIAFEVPTKMLAATALENPPRQRIHASFLALIKDQTGQVVEKISRDIPYEVPADRYAGFSAGNLTFSRPFTLPPGRYTVDTAVLDRENLKAGTRRVSLILPEPGALSISSVSLVRRLEPLQNAADANDPFQFGKSRVTPSLDNSIPGGDQATLYFVVYPARDEPAPPKVLVQYLRDGKEIGRYTPEINDASKDAAGAIPLVAAARLEPGQYDVTVTAVQGTKSTRQSASFTVLEPSR